MLKTQILALFDAYKAHHDELFAAQRKQIEMMIDHHEKAGTVTPEFTKEPSHFPGKII